MSDGAAPILIKRTNAPKVLQMGQRTFDRMRAAGKIGPPEIRLGGGVFYSRAELSQWIASRRDDGTLPSRSEWIDMYKERANA